MSTQQPFVQSGQPLPEFLKSFWERQIATAEQETPDYRHPPLPLARIKKVMKSDPDVKMIAADAPILFCKACEIFIAEITGRAFIVADSNKRRTLSRADIAKALTKSDHFDFLIDIVPREEAAFSGQTGPPPSVPGAGGAGVNGAGGSGTNAGPIIRKGGSAGKHDTGPAPNDGQSGPMDMDGHHQHPPRHQGQERKQSHDHQSRDHSHGTEGKNEEEALDEKVNQQASDLNLTSKMAADPVAITPKSIPLPKTADIVSSADGSYLTYPPFPTAPGVIPFKEFKEGGICIEPGPDDAEVDTFGIPTVPIRSRHSTDHCKTKSKRKWEDMKGKKGKKSKPIEQRLWWEQWEDAEAIRFCTGFNPYASDHDKIIAAAADFTSDRVWPVNFPSESGPKFIWEKFQRYLGVQEGSAVPSAKQAKAIQEEEADFDDDDDMDEREDGDGEDAGPGIVPDPVTGLIDVKKIQVPIPGKQTVDQKLKAFFDDPEKSIKIFMTSYARSKGYIWANVNLDCIPRVLHYFINFLLRSKVLPQFEHQLRRSLEVIALAKIELPNTSNIAKTFPDKFSLACNACWGQKADGYKALATYDDEPVVDDNNNTSEEPEAKRQKCDADIPEPAAPVEPEKETPAETTTDTWGTGGDDGGWGASAEGWGPDDVAAGEENSWATLQVDEPESLLSLLGPTVLPLTHTSGIVERSMRRILSITRPPPSVAKSPPLPDGVYEPNAEAVELELDRRFAKVVLAPMIDWDGGESPVYTRPVILATSRGAVVVQGDKNDTTPASPTPVQGGSSPQPHNPEIDEITVLIDNVANQIDYLCVGMAIGGTWVQLVRQEEPDVVVAKKKGSKSKKSSYWYLDELALTVPSFWTVDE